MKPSAKRALDDAAWDRAVCEGLIEELQALRGAMLQLEIDVGGWMTGLDRARQASASNLAHYLAMRRIDLRRIQERLAWIGVSSLGRAETHVLANLNKVLGILHVLAGREWKPQTLDEPAGFQRGRAMLERNAEALFGEPPAERDVRIMVTLPSQAASDFALIDAMVESGMDIARINCAHDGPDAWAAMADGIRKASEKRGRPVRILMDLGGPKLRTGPVEPGPEVVKLRPARDEFGAVRSPLRVGLRPAGSGLQIPGAALHLGADPSWLAQLHAGDRIDLTDARAAERKLTVLSRHDAGVLVECARTTYLTPQTRLRLHRTDVRVRDCVVRDVPARAGSLTLHRGDLLHLVREGVGSEAIPRTKQGPARPATMPCTLPQALDAVRKGDRVWFDDGRIGGVVERKSARAVVVRITVARDAGEPLVADKGINLPDTALDLPALTDKDREDLSVVAKLADIVGLSFAQSAQDVRELRERLGEAGGDRLGLILKIETRRGFEHLPEMLFAAMGASAAGVMIARGDLAVECGWERMAEVQEEILCACEAAHLPVVWATQVLETLAKTGTPSRAEITDAAAGVRAECVMLNKGPHILDAIRALDDILRRMQAHQAKKRPLLRALKSWRVLSAPSGPGEPPIGDAVQAGKRGAARSRAPRAA